jgi:hypothetical protein
MLRTDDVKEAHLAMREKREPVFRDLPPARKEL